MGHRINALVLSVMSAAVAMAAPQLALALGWNPTDFLVAGFNNSRIAVYDQNLVFRGYLDTSFPSVTGLDFASSSDLVAAGRSPGQVKEYLSNGTILNSFTHPDVGSPVDSKIGPSDHVFIATQTARSVREMTLSGASLRSLGTAQYTGVAVLPGLVLWAGAVSGRIDVFSIATGLPTGSIVLDNGQVFAQSMYYSPVTNTVLMADPGTARLYERTTSGAFVRMFTGGSPQYGVTRGPNGDVYATSYALNLIYHWTSGGTFLGSVSVSPQVSGPGGIVWAGNSICTPQTWYRDLDGDTYGNPLVSQSACMQPVGWVSDSSDCNDAKATIHPGATEIVGNQVDEDCNGAEVCFQDADHDSYGSTATVDSFDIDCFDFGEATNSTDCDDARSDVHPFAVEVCDVTNTDEDCNGAADDADSSAVGKTSWYLDADADGFGDAAHPMLACDPPVGHVSSPADCDDTNPAIHPGGVEVCDAANRDEDCDGAVDDADSSATGKTSWYADADADGFGNAADSTLACDPPAGRVADATDCDDSDPTRFPGNVEVCDGKDNDCDGVVDDSLTFISMPTTSNGAPGSNVAVPITVHPADGLHSFDIAVHFLPTAIDSISAATTPATADWTLTTNFSTPGTAVISLFGVLPLSGTSVDIATITFHVTGGNGDTTPLDITRATTDDGVTTCPGDGHFSVCLDADNDGFTACGGDCNDNDPTVHPGASENNCNNVDSDCDGSIDEDYVPSTTSCGTALCGSSGLLVCLSGGILSDTCNPASTNGDPCTSDGNTCTFDACSGGSCAHPAVADGTACSDGSACTTLDACTTGVCTGGPPPNCDDVNVCTNDTCIPASGCDHAPICTIAGHIYYNKVTPAGPNPPNAGTDGPDVTKPIAGESVARTSDLSSPAAAMTDGTGLYQFLGDAGGNVTLIPQLRSGEEDECQASITAADASLMAKATVELTRLSPAQMLAADATNNGTVSSLDASLISQKAVATICTSFHLPTETAHGGSAWGWVPASKNFNPLTGLQNYDFTAVLYGDVTGNWSDLPPLASEGESGTGQWDNTEGEPSESAGSATAAVISTVGPMAGSTVGPAAAVGQVAAPIVASPSAASAVGPATARSSPASLYRASGPMQRPDGLYDVVLGVQNSDGILGIDMALRYDPAKITIRGVAVTGLAANFNLVSNDQSGSDRLAIYGVAPMQGSGNFLVVTLDIHGLQTSVQPFDVIATANEGLIPLSPGGASGHGITMDGE